MTRLEQSNMKAVLPVSIVIGGIEEFSFVVSGVKS
jgi:hypothetical protein